ncbi:lipopolysaccharide biosynthesis glycosyltransferase [Orbus hercynius]|uniref:Lipopolysaccharide biosynthesis glycosyltransferase n=1 Tax=Orbus hercynius TaxID=593135 RepID=A0A495RJI6_9GAMM|nr:glycosyltransferase family 8 protein [Orbus hercynius]RKS87702.1 lipopolysaccharide biosynthesis glycosyltransferase [Orbus hercynius]
MQNLIKNKTIINEHSSRCELNVFLCFNDKYAFQAGVTVSSLLKNNTNISIHLFMIDVSDNNKTYFQQLSYYNNTIIFYDVDSSIIANEHKLKDHHIPTSLRIFVPQILTEIEKLIYLDSDIICHSSLSPLLEINFEDNIVLAAKDEEESQKTQCPLFDIHYGEYFNAGVMIIDTNAWNNNNITQKSMDLLDNRRKEFRLLDQDALNIALKNQTKIIANNYNKIVSICEHQIVPALNKNDVLIHFAGPIKPWFADTIPELYQYYQQISPWNAIKLDKRPKESASKYRLLAKQQFKEKHPLKAIKYTLIYILKKLIKK